jgi:hypothetical protein
MAGIRALQSLPVYSIFHNPAVTKIGNPKRIASPLQTLGCHESSGAFTGEVHSIDLEQSIVLANNLKVVGVLFGDNQGAIGHYVPIARAVKVIGHTA